MVPGSIVTPIGFLITGWAAQKHVHWIVVDIVGLSPPSGIDASLTAVVGSSTHWRRSDSLLPIDASLCC